MSRYNAVEDPLCYPGTQVLRNKADIQDQDELDQFEQLMFESRAEERLPEGALDFTHYLALHHHYFQDVYDWAGDVRGIRTGKGSNWFCYPEYIVTQAEQLFGELAAYPACVSDDAGASGWCCSLGRTLFLKLRPSACTKFQTVR